MEEDRRGAAAEGMGARPSGPAFDAPQVAAHAPPPASSAAPDPGVGARSQPNSAEVPRAADFRPRPRRLPAVLTALAVLLVGAVVAVASLMPSVAPPTGSNPPATRPVSPPPARSSSATNEIPFSTPYGDGVLVLIGHAWSKGGRTTPTHTFLTVRVRIRAVAGEIDVDPTYFQILDGTGDVYDSIPAIDGQRELRTTSLSAGESVAGGVSFDVPRGEVTLLMGDGAQGITPVRVPG